MKINAPPSLKVEDFPSLMAASGGEAEKLFRAINTAILSLSMALTHGLTFGDNVLAAVKTLTFDATKLPKFAPGITARPVGLLVLQAWVIDPTNGNTTPVSLSSPAWTTDKDGQVVVSGLGTLDAAKRYRVTFLVVGG